MATMQNIYDLFSWIWSCMTDLSWTIGSYTINLAEVFICAILFTLAGYFFGKLINPWSGDEE